MISRDKGFTFIELMAAVAIVSILAVVSMSAYNNYAIRSKVTEGLGFAARARTAVTEAYYTNGIMPANNSQAGLEPPEDFDEFKYISRLEVTSVPVAGSITLTIKIPALGDNNQLQLVPSTADRIVEWDCRPPEENGIDESRVPANCRG